MAEDPRSARTPPAAPLPTGAEAQPAANGEAAERRSEQRLRALFDAMFQFIGLMEPDGTLVEVNRTALDFGGLRPEDVIGKKFWDCPWWQVSEEAQEQVKAAVRRAASGEFVRYETEFLGAGGRVATIDFSIKPVRGDDGAVDLLIPEGRVITEAVQARRMQEGLTAAQVGTFEIDLATQAVHRPASTDSVFGLPPDGAPRDLDTYLDRIHPGDLPVALGAIRRAVEEGGEQFAAFRLLLPDGRVRWAAARGVVLPGVRGGSPRLIGAIMDVTAQRTAEQERRRDDEQRRAALEAARLGTWDYDLDEGVVRMDARCRAIFGHDRDVATFEEALSWVHPEDQPEVARAMQVAADPTTGGRFDVEYRLLRPDGAQRWIRATGNVLFEGEGKERRAAHYVGVVVDETERKEAERARALHAAIVASSDDAIVSKTLDGVITTWNAGAERVFGYTAEEAVGRPVLMLIPPERRDEEDHILSRIRRGERVAHYDTVRLTKDGRRIDVSLAVSPIRDAAGRVVGASKVARDVTEQKRAEAVLRASEAEARRLATVVARTTSGVVVTDVEGAVVWANEAFTRLTGYTLDDVRGRRPAEVLQGPGSDASTAAFVKERVAARAPFVVEVLNYRKDGTPYWTRVEATPLRADDGTFEGYVAVQTDTTERRQAGEALRQSEERFRLATSAVAGMVYDWDVTTGEVFRTEGLYALVGVHPEDVPEDRTWWVDRVHPDDRDRVYDLIRTVLETDADRYALEYRTRHEDGRWVHLWDRGHIVRDDAGQAVRVVGSATDVTDRKRAEEALTVRARQQQTVAVLGGAALRQLTDDPRALQALMEQAVEAVAQTLGVVYAEVLELLPGGAPALLRAGAGWQEGLVGQAEVDTGADSQAGYTLLSGAPVVVEDLATDARFGGPALLVEHGVVSGMSCVIPGAGGEPWGVLGAHTTAARAFTQDDVHFLQAVANLLGAAIQRQATVDALRESETRFRQLADSAPVLIWISDEENRGTYFNRQWLAFTGRTLEQELGFGWIESVHPDDRAEAAAFCQRHFDARAPFRMEFRLRRADGAYRWVLDHGIPRFTVDGTFLGYIGTCFDVNDQQQAQARALLLAETGRLVEQALDYEGALREIARVAVPGFADWCAVDLLHDDGTISAVAIAHVDPDKVRWGWELRAREPIDPEAPTGVPNVIRTGEPEVYPAITDEMLVAAARDEEHLRLLREIGFSSAVTVPMRAGEEVVGAITFVQTESGRRFEAGDVEAALEIGRRAGTTIETARLHRALQESEGRFRAISALTSDFAYAARLTEEGTFEREWVSGAYERITGYEPDEVGDVDPWRRLVYPEDVAAGEAHLEALLSGRPSVSEHRLVTKAGEVRWVRDYARPERDDEGRLVRIIGAVQDITEQKEAEHALREREARLRAVIDTALDGIITINERGTVETLNPAAVRIFGYTPEEVVGRNVRMLMPEPYRSEHDGYLAHYLETGERRIIGIGREVEGRRKDGTVFPMELAVSETYLDGRRLFTGLVRDITARKETEAALRESEARFRQLAEAVPEIVYTIDAGGRTDYLNARWFAYTGQPLGVDPDRAVGAVIHPGDAERVAEAWAAAFEAGETFEAELRLRRHDGPYRWFLTRVVPVRGADGRVGRWFGTSTDIHAQKAAEAELAERVAARTEELERSNRELDQFAYVASHDLKGPLRGIDNLATWIAEDAGDRLPEPSRRHLDLLLGRVQRLEALLDSLLAYSRAGRLIGLAEDVDAAALVRDVVELLDAPGAVTFAVADDLPTLTTYRAPLELVFRNLLTNAVKHADRPDLHVRVTAAGGGAPEGYVTFAVADDGPGIPPEYHERIFGLFQTLRPRDEVEGSGMGLAVVKKTVESLGGTIRVESSPGAGTTFYFTWPRSV